MRPKASCLAVLMLSVEPAVRAQETVDVQELVTRCADAGGVLTLHTDLRVEGGAAETGACRILLDFCRLFLVGVELSASDFFVVDGQPGGELQIDHSILSRSDEEGPAVDILLRAHHFNIESTVVDFDGSIHLETGMGDQGVVHVESVILRSRSKDLRVGASGNFDQGTNIVLSSTLLAATDINITASFNTPGLRGGYVSVQESSLIAGGSISLQTGDAGRTQVRGNGVLRATGPITLLSSEESRTIVDQNRIAGDDPVQISSGGLTSVSGNIFLRGSSVEIDGPLCVSSGNFPPVECSLTPARGRPVESPRRGILLP